MCTSKVTPVYKNDAHAPASRNIFGEFAKLNEFSSEDVHKNLSNFKTSEPASQPLPVLQNSQLTLF
jgi:hypothetical protein